MVDLLICGGESAFGVGCRSQVPLLVMWVGAATALFAATIAVAQNDIKKVLAYSTVSQLGFMVAAAGMGAEVAAMFHLATHAFFKGLLFLAAGSVILGVEHGQEHLHVVAAEGRHPLNLSKKLKGIDFFLQKIRRLLSMELIAVYNYPTVPLSMGMNLLFVPGLIPPQKTDVLPYFQAAIITRIMVTS